MTTLIARYIESLHQRNCSPRTIQHYSDFLNRCHDHLLCTRGMGLSEEHIAYVTTEILEGYIQHKVEQDGLAITSRNNYVAILRSFFAFLCARKIIAENPMAAIDTIGNRYGARPVNDEEKFYDQEQIKRLYEHLQALGTKTTRRDLALVALMLGSAMRISEACSLNVSDLEDMQKGYVKVLCKGGRWERIAVAPFAVEHVRHYLALRVVSSVDEPLFLSNHDRRLTRETAWKSLRKKQKAIGIKTGTHILRHSALTELDAVAGASVATDAALHASSGTTKRYTHRRAERVGAALQRVGYGALFTRQSGTAAKVKGLGVKNRP